MSCHVATFAKDLGEVMSCRVATFARNLEIYDINICLNSGAIYAKPKHGSKHGDNRFVFTYPDDEVKAWLIAQIRRMAETVGLELTDKTGYENSNSSLQTQADAEFDALVTENRM